LFKLLKITYLPAAIIHDQSVLLTTKIYTKRDFGFLFALSSKLLTTNYP